MKNHKWKDEVCQRCGLKREKHTFKYLMAISNDFFMVGLVAIYYIVLGITWEFNLFDKTIKINIVKHITKKKQRALVMLLQKNLGGKYNE